MRLRACLHLASILTIGLVASGCDNGNEFDTTYGRMRGRSINGTGAFAEILRGRGHEVRLAVKAGDSLNDWADVIVRFAPYPGPIDRQEAEWMTRFLTAKPNRRLVYLPQDFDAEPEFWNSMLAAQSKETPQETIRAIEARRDRSQLWQDHLPPRTKAPADPQSWFEFEPRPAAPTLCKTLEGPWAAGVDPTAAAVSRHEVFQVAGGEEVLLSGDQAPLAISWTFDNQSKVLVVANASFLLNASLLNRARRPLTIKLVDWIGGARAHVAFLEGQDVASDNPKQENQESASSPFHLFTVWPFNWIAVHVLLFLAMIAFSLAVRLGRPRPEPPSGVERPSAHPEALGALLARTRRDDVARFLLESYRRWRHQSPIAGRTAPTPPPPR